MYPFMIKDNTAEQKENTEGHDFILCASVIFYIFY